MTIGTLHAKEPRLTRVRAGRGGQCWHVPITPSWARRWNNRAHQAVRPFGAQQGALIGHTRQARVPPSSARCRKPRHARTIRAPGAWQARRDGRRTQNVIVTPRRAHQTISLRHRHGRRVVRARSAQSNVSAVGTVRPGVAVRACNEPRRVGVRAGAASARLGPHTQSKREKYGTEQGRKCRRADHPSSESGHGNSLGAPRGTSS